MSVETASRAQIVVCDWIPPEFGAVGQYELGRAREAARAGGRVLLIGLGKESMQERERIGAGELTIERLAAPRNPKESFVRRALWALAINRRLARATRDAQRRSRPASIMVTGSPPLLAYWLLLQNHLFWRQRIVYRMTDFYPEVALAAGKARWLAPSKPFFRWLRRKADSLEVLSFDMKRRLAAEGLEDRIVVKRDSSPIKDWRAAEPAVHPFKGHPVLLYSGNWGVAHESATICEAYRRHVQEGSNRVRLWINGQGVRVGEVKAFCETHGLPLKVTPPATLPALAGILQVADAHLVLLDRAFWGYVFPSKTYACLEAGQPLLYIGPAESDVHLLATRHAETYWHAAPGDVDAALRALEELAARPRRAIAPRRIDFQESAAANTLEAVT
ncbi:MAG: hypothetical protein JNJ73_20215 [Hyphomonadaceae bacterium]|nr:hypothetical protein [Hyphomonadaceae bacterium]